MNTEKKDLPFAESYWKEEGGEKWVEYIDETEATLQEFNKKLLEATDINLGDTVLDIGCGGASNSMELARRVGETGTVTGVDISAPILVVASKRTENISNLQLIEADAASLQLEAGHYDLLFSRFGVMFFSDPVTAFKNFQQALSEGGKMVFLCWRSLQENSWMGVPVKAVVDIVPPEGPPPDPTMPGPFSLYDKNRIQSILTAAGFTKIDIDPVDIEMNLGPLDKAVDYFTRMGPAVALLAEATEDQKQRAVASMENAMQHYISSGNYLAPAAAWIVTARK